MGNRDILVSFFCIVVMVLSASAGLFGHAGAGTILEIPREGLRFLDHKDEPGPAGNGYFTQNRGQWDPHFLWVAGTEFGNIALGTDCIYYDLRKVETGGDEEGAGLSVEGRVLKVEFVDANNAVPFGVGEMPHRNNYFYGNDGTAWATDVPNYRSVMYNDLWDGIDLRYVFTADGPKYEFIVHPDGDHSRIRLHLAGHSAISQIGDDLVISLGSGFQVQDRDLRVFYRDGHDILDAGFRVISGSDYGFILGEYDRTRTVVIDPLIYSTFVSGSNWEHARDVTYDSSGNAYVTGQTISTDFPATSGAYNENHSGDQDAYVFKLDASGSSLLYCTYVGGSGTEWGYGIGVDSSGNAYVTGCTKSSNFPTTSGAYDETYASDYDVFVFKLNSAGAQLSYSTFIGGSGADIAYRLQLDASGNAFITGRTATSSFPTTAGAYDTGHNGMDDLFVLELNATGTGILKSTFVGGLAGERGCDLILDEGNNVYVTGYSDYTNTNAFPTTSGAYDTSHNGLEDVIVIKLNSSFDKLLYSTFVGGPDPERGLGIGLDSSGFVYVAGWTKSTTFPTTADAYDTTHKGTNMAFVLKLNNTWDSLLYSTFLGGSGNDEANDMVVDPSGFAYVVGSTSSTNYPTTGDAENGTHSGGILDLFFTKLSASGGALGYSTFRGGSSTDYGYAINLDASGNLYLGGVSASTDFPTTPGAYQTGHKGGDDPVVVKFSFSSPIAPPRNLDGVYGNGFVDLSWDPPVNMPEAKLTGYKLYRGAQLGSESLLITLGNMTSYNDTTVTPGKKYYYYATALNATGESYPSNRYIAMDRIKPNFLTDATPSSATTGDEHLFSVSITDNFGVGTAFVEYWYGSGGHMNTSMTPGTGSFWNKKIVVNHTLEPLYYAFHVNDTSDNWNRLSATVTVVDNDPVEFISDSSTGHATTGDEFMFSAEVYDNIGVGGVWVEYWYGSGTHENASLAESGGIWTRTIDVQPDTTDALSYILHANDTSDNWNQTTKVDIPVSDNDRPVLISDQTPALATTGDSFKFSLETSDNIDVDEASVEYRFGTGPANNVSMTGSGSGAWDYSITVPDTLDSLYYRFHFSDGSGNWNETPELSVPVHDNDKPSAAYDNSAKFATTGDDLSFSVDIVDNIEVDSAYLEYWFGDGAHKNVSMTGSGTFVHTISVPEDSTDSLHYVFHMSDTSGNWNRTAVSDVAVSDNDPPELDEYDYPSTTQPGTKLTIKIYASDNIGISDVKIVYWFEDEANVTSSMVISQGAYVIELGIPIDTVKTFYFYITAFDLAGNKMDTDRYSVLVEDTEKPTIEPIADLSVKAGERVNVKIDASDNVGIDEIIWEGTPFPVTGDTFAGFVNETGEYNIKVTVRDKSGNSATTGFKLTVEPKDKNDKDTKQDSDKGASNVMLFGVIVVVIVIVVILVVLFLMMKRKKQEKIEPETPPAVTDYYQMPPQPDGTLPPYPQQFPPGEFVQQQANGYGQYPQVPTQAYPSLPEGTAPPGPGYQQAGDEYQAPVEEPVQPEGYDRVELPPQDQLTEQPGQEQQVDEPEPSQEQSLQPNTPEQQPEPVYAGCPFCGAQIAAGTQLCTNCGNAIVWQ